MRHVRVALLTLALLGGLAGVCPATGESPTFPRLTVVVPAAPDGGWDHLARAMKRTLEAEGLVRAVDLVYRPGAGGTIGLAEFINAHRGDPAALLVTGTTMVGAIQANKATVSLLDTTPIARLANEDLWVLAVPSPSPIGTLSALVDALRRNPTTVTFGGGSYGSPDHTLLSLFARSIHVEAVNYVPFPGGGDAAKASLRGEVTVVVSGFASVASEVTSGRLKVLALACGRPVPGIDAPVLMDGGRPIALENWRGVVGAPGLDEADRDRLLRLIEAMVGSQVWKSASRDYFWLDSYLPGSRFGAFFETEQRRAAHGQGPYPLHPFTLGASPSSSAGTSSDPLGAWTRAGPVVVAVAAGMVLLVWPATLYAWRRARRLSRRREIEALDLQFALEQLARTHERSEALVKGLSNTIDRQFAAWGLTAAEREVALLMLKGIKHREIAELRRTTERTVRQQALGVYRKANLDGRADLAAYFLEDILAPLQTDSRSS